MLRLRSNHSGVLVALAAAATLCGCADVDFGNQQAWFAKPLDVAGQKAGYTFSELQETRQRQKPITANDLVNSNGSCPPPAAQPMPRPAPGQAAAPAPVDTAALLGGGVALGMSECDIVFRAGQPNSVQIGRLPNGDRSAVLTFNSGPRPGIYRFEAGALKEMDGVSMPGAPPEVAKKKSPKSAKAGKSTKPPKKNDT